MSKKILIVEDCRDLLEVLGEALVVMGWETILAESGHEAMSKLADELPSVILLDMRMAMLQGVELTVILKAHPVYRNVPILGASVDSSELAHKRGLALGCDDLISHPIALAELEMRLINILSMQRLKAIKALEPINTVPNLWQPASQHAGRR